MKVLAFTFTILAVIASSFAADEAVDAEPIPATHSGVVANSVAVAPESKAVPEGNGGRSSFLAVAPVSAAYTGAYPYAGYPISYTAPYPVAYTAGYRTFPAAYSAYSAYPTAYHSAAPLIAGRSGAFTFLG